MGGNLNSKSFKEYTGNLIPAQEYEYAMIPCRLVEIYKYFGQAFYLLVEGTPNPSLYNYLYPSSQL
jgi:hypothetical protein